MKTELLIQMDGLNKSDELVFVLAASNLPWELDPAMLRRLEKRILIDLPSQEALEAMFRHHLPPVIKGEREGGYEIHTELDYALLARSAPGYSGSDITLVCKEAAMRVLRRVFALLEEPANLESGRMPRFAEKKFSSKM
jgi:katanin p60 ATPase-containing subunit A1